MTKAELKLIAALLDLAADAFGNHSCNDFNLSEFMTKEEAKKLATEYAKWNGDDEDVLPRESLNCDFALMAWMAQRCDEEAAK